MFSKLTSKMNAVLSGGWGSSFITQYCMNSSALLCSVRPFGSQVLLTSWRPSPFFTAAMVQLDTARASMDANMIRILSGVKRRRMVAWATRRTTVASTQKNMLMMHAARTSGPRFSREWLLRSASMALVLFAILVESKAPVQSTRQRILWRKKRGCEKLWEIKRPLSRSLIDCLSAFFPSPHPA